MTSPTETVRVFQQATRVENSPSPTRIMFLVAEGGRPYDPTMRVVTGQSTYGHHLVQPSPQKSAFLNVTSEADTDSSVLKTCKVCC